MAMTSRAEMLRLPFFFAAPSVPPDSAAWRGERWGGVRESRPPSEKPRRSLKADCASESHGGFYLRSYRTLAVPRPPPTQRSFWQTPLPFEDACGELQLPPPVTGTTWPR
eukprot:8489301-Pyramimonas_sp.AAC.1